MRLRVFTLIAAFALFGAACGSSGSSPDGQVASLSDEKSETTTADNQAVPADGEEGGDANEEPAEGGTSNGEISQEDVNLAFAEYEACMEENGAGGVVGGVMGFGDGGGAEVPDGGTDNGDPNAAAVSREDFEAADEACNPILDRAFGSFDLNPEQEAELADDMLAVQRCLADKGIEVEMSGNSISVTGDIDMEEMNEAMEECTPDARIYGGTESGN